MAHLKLLLLLLGVSSTLAIKFQVYREPEYKGLIYDLEEYQPVSDLCYDLKPYARGPASSIRVDTCILAYEDVGCTGHSVKLTPPSLTNLDAKISSFHLCNETYGAKVIRTDFFKGDELLAEYKDVCGCQDLPEEVSFNLTRINNYGNCITVYSSNECGGQKRDIPSGVSAISEDLPSLSFYIRSVSACGPRTDCVRLDSKIFKFVLEFPEDGLEDSMRNVELAAKTTFYNNGSATVTQQYHASKSVKEIFTVSRSESISEMESKTTEHNFKTEVSVGWQGFGVSVSSSASYALRDAYTWNRTEEMEESKSYEYSEEKTFAVTQTIQIPPCVEYEVSSMLSLLENVPVPYWVYAKVQGTSSGQPILAEELSGHVMGMEFIEAFDNFTAIFRSKHTLLANVGVETWITGEGTSIENCKGSL